MCEHPGAVSFLAGQCCVQLLPQGSGGLVALLETARGTVSMYVVQGLGLGRTSCEHGMYVLSFCFIEGFFKKLFLGSDSVWLWGLV